MESQAVQKLFDDYFIREECYPSQESEPSHDQLSGLNQVSTGGGNPYVDFSVFGPHGVRALRKLVYATYLLSTATGEWQRKELPGPPDFDAWWKSFKVYKTAMVLLAICGAERLEAYGEHIRELAALYPWHLVYQSDVRMRSEQFQRIKRELEASNTAGQVRYGFKPARPWPAVFAAAVLDSEKFWNSEVREPAVIWLASGGSRSGGGSSSSKRKEKSDDSDDEEPPAKRRKGAKRKTTKGDLSECNSSKQIWLKNKKGLEICNLWNHNKCGKSNAQSKCKNSRSHQCNKCLGPHQAGDAACKGYTGT